MKQQTRDLLRLVVDDVAASVLDAITLAPKTREELIAELGASEQAIDRALGRLKDRGLAADRAVPTGKKGRPKKRWAPTVPAATTAFDAAAIAFHQAILQAQLGELEADDP